MKHVLAISCFLFAFLLASCSSSLYKQPMLASTKVAAVPAHKVLGKVETKSCSMVFWFFEKPVNFKSMYGKVLADAENLGADAVIDLQATAGGKLWIIPLLFMRDCYAISGTAVKFSSGPSGWDAADESGSSAWDAPPPGNDEQQEPKTKSAWD